MKTETKLWVMVLVVVLFSILLAAVDLCRTYKSARRLAAQDAERFTDCIYAGTTLSYSQIYTPSKFFRFPHWEVTYDSTNPVHGFTRIVTLSEARTKANITPRQ
jgi:hypothetical protein